MGIGITFVVVVGGCGGAGYVASSAKAAQL